MRERFIRGPTNNRQIKPSTKSSPSQPAVLAKHWSIVASIYHRKPRINHLDDSVLLSVSRRKKLLSASLERYRADCIEYSSKNDFISIDFCLISGYIECIFQRSVSAVVSKFSFLPGCCHVRTLETAIPLRRVKGWLEFACKEDRMINRIFEPARASLLLRRFG